MDFSVVIPTNRNDEPLNQAVVSTLNAASGFDVEIVIVCDGVDLVPRWGRRVRVLSSEAPGICAALNVGLEAARGRFVVRMDSDDICSPQRFHDNVRLIERHQADLLAGGIVKFGPDFSPRWEAPPYTRNDLYEALAHTGYAVAHPAVTFRRSLVLDVGGYDDKWRGIEDLDLWLRVLAARSTRFAAVSAPAVLYRVHADQASRLADSATERIASRLRREPGMESACCDPGCPGRLASFYAERQGRWAAVCPRRHAELSVRALSQLVATRPGFLAPLLGAIYRQSTSRTRGAQFMRRERQWVAHS